jgi:transcriptional regulator with GAF, ATPase, and Fis domain
MSLLRQVAMLTTEVLWLRAEDCSLLHPAPPGPGDTPSAQHLPRLLELVLLQQDRSELARVLLDEVSSVLRAEQAAVFEATPQWELRWQSSRGGRGRAPLPPHALLGGVLEREAGVSQPADGRTPAFLAAPVTAGRGGQLAAHGGATLSENLVLLVSRAGGAFTRADLEYGLAAGHYLAAGLKRAAAWEKRGAALERLEILGNVARQVIEKRELMPLLDAIAEQASRLVSCERASLFIWDPAHHQLVARPALGMDGGELRIPEDTGVVGKVLQTGRACTVDDVRCEPSWNSQVDQSSGFQTRNLLCVPLLESSGRCLGVLEVLNKTEGRFTLDDVEVLEALAWHAAAALHNGRERETLLRNNALFERQARQGCCIIGESRAVRDLRGTIERLARTDLPVLVLGESGTGKEVVARSVHYSSPREHQPFIPVNCAAIAESLLESELFGHVKGAFTGADQDRAGCFETANGGTLFLDEIGDLSAGGQAKLLRVLENKEITRVGSSRPVPINTRIVAATNRDLTDSIRAGKFREDLFYRLTVVTIYLPPLRERREDVVPLAEYYLEQFCRDAGRRRPPLSDEARRRLQEHSWPGNVRELRNLMERVAFLCSGETVEPEDLPFIVRPSAAGEGKADPSGRLPLAEATDAFQRNHIRRAIEQAGGNMSEAAKLLGLHRSNLYRKMRMLGMEVS